MCYAQGVHRVESPDLLTQVISATALALGSAPPLDVGAQLIFFSAVFLAHRSRCIGGRHSEGPLRIPPRFDAHVLPGLPEGRRHVQARSEEGPVSADRLTEPFAGTYDRLEVRGQPWFDAAEGVGTVREARDDHVHRAHESRWPCVHRRHPAKTPPPPSEHDAIVRNRRHGAVTSIGITRVAPESCCLELVPERIVPFEFFRNTRGSRHRRLGEVDQTIGVRQAIHLKGMVRGIVRKEQVMNLFYFAAQFVNFSTDMELLIQVVAEGYPAAKDPETGLARLLVDEFTDLDFRRFVAVIPARRPHLGFIPLEYQAEAHTRARLKKGEGLPHRVGWSCRDEVVTDSSRDAPFLAEMSIGFRKRGY